MDMEGTMSKIKLTSIIISLSLLISTTTLTAFGATGSNSNSQSLSNSSKGLTLPSEVSKDLYGQDDIKGEEINGEEKDRVFKEIFKNFKGFNNGKVTIDYIINNGIRDNKAVFINEVDLSNSYLYQNLIFDGSDNYYFIVKDNMAATSGANSKGKWVKANESEITSIATVKEIVGTIGLFGDKFPCPDFLNCVKKEDGSYLFYNNGKIETQDILKYINSYSGEDKDKFNFLNINITGGDLLIKADGNKKLEYAGLRGLLTIGTNPSFNQRIEFKISELNSIKVNIPEEVKELFSSNPSSSNSSKASN